MRALVTGGTGFIGGALVRALRARGWDVTVLARTPAAAAPLEALGCTIAAGDVTDPRSVEAAVAGHDAVFHAAAWYVIGARDRARMERINVEGTRIVLGAAASAGAARIVHVSSVAVFGPLPPGRVGDGSEPIPDVHASLYEETKARAHREAEALAASGAPVTIVMPCAVYGPGDRSLLGLLLRLYAKRLLIALPYQDAGVSLVHVEDCAEGIARAAEKGVAGAAYVLGGDNETIGGMFRRVAPITGIRAPARLPERAMALARPFGPLIARAVRQEPGMITDFEHIVAGSTMFSSDKAERELGYSWRPIEAGIPPTVASMRNRARTP